SKEKHYLTDLFQKTADAFVFIDEAGKIVDTNESFLTLSENPNIDELIGKSFSDFLRNSATDLKILTDNSKRLGKIRNYATEFVTTFGSKIPVTISSTWVSNEDNDFYGFILRDSTNVEFEKQNDNEQHSWAATTKLVGSAPLKELVAQTGDIAERICLETALNLTSNNKVAAADLLSLSRQSLYVKLRKHNLLDNKD
ncbi:PAS domain-containing protein, partial [Paracoccaceae bacterium]|nr:PAS domain-containing protein [Paracoccaceae bacterium]